MNDPAQYRSIQNKVLEYETSRARFGLRERDVDQRISARTAVRFTVREELLAALLGPLALLSVLLFAVPYWITGLVGRQVRALESRATGQLVGGVLIYGVWMGLLAAAVGLAYGAATTPAAFLLLSILAVAGLFALEREAAVIGTVRAFLAIRHTPLKARAHLKRHRAEIVTVLERAREWLEQGE